jgi:hypothetical protein
MQNQPSTQQKTLIHCIEAIGIMATAFKGDTEKINPEDPHISALCSFLRITPVQAMLFSVIFILNFKNRSVDIDDMSQYMETTNLCILRVLPDIEELDQRRLICRYTSNSRITDTRRASIFDMGYMITRNILNAILKSDHSLLERKKNFTMVALLEEIAKMVEDRDDGLMTFGELVSETNTMLQNNAGQEFVSKVTSYGFRIENLLILLYVCREIVTGSESVNLSRTCEKIYEDVDNRFQVRQSLLSGTNELMEQEMVKLKEGYFRTDREILLTEKAFTELFGKDKDLFQAKDKSRKELIAVGKIKEVRLFFNREEEEQLSFVTRTLHQSNFIKTIRRLEQQSMACGVAILFHGAPGTGKTASVYEIARRTGRDIFLVDISSTKSMWFGESEKIVKELFDRYRRISESSEKAPILLFNECDGVFSKRLDVSRSAVAQTENAIQNIILQEIETLKGILIATTNLTKNLDQAFERRFLFKIEFHKPGPEVLQKIWMDKISILKAPEAQKLAERFDLSGGNIENIARKVQMHQILHGEYPCFERLVAFCDEEQMVKTGRNKIGFL